MIEARGANGLGRLVVAGSLVCEREGGELKVLPGGGLTGEVEEIEG